MDLLGPCESGFERVDGLAWHTAVSGPQRRGRVGDLDLDWRLTARERGHEIHLRVTNPTAQPIALERLDVLRVPRGLAGHGLRVMQTGWQSWSMATPLVAAEWWIHDRPVEPPLLRPMLPPTEADRVLVPWMTVVATDRGAVLIGFAEAARQNGTISVIPTFEGHALVASVHLEGRILAPGAAIDAEPLRVMAADVDAYADEVAHRMHARPSPAVTGWCSWYTFYANVSERDVLENLEALRTHRLDVEVVQIDHGYERVIGDWLVPSERFPNGLKTVAEKIHKAGRKAGIWVAPFMVGDRSEVASKHPEWLLRDAAGQPFVAVRAWGNNLALDVTHPDAAAWLRGVFRTIVDDWGYDYLKLDFLYAGCLRGRRHEPGLTSVEAYRRGMRLIREAVGDRFVVGCGAPFLPSVGFVDAMRVSPDTAIHWADDGHGTSPAMLNAIRSNLAHGWMNGRWWRNDPDCLILNANLTFATFLPTAPEAVPHEVANARAPTRRVGLTGEELRTWATVVALSGGMLMLTDDLGKLDAPQIAMARRMLPPSGRAYEAFGPFTRGLPARLESDGLIALFNWTSNAAALHVEASGHLFDCWSGEHWIADGRVDLGMTAAHGVRLLRVTADRGRPQVVGSTLHVLGGLLEVVDERWDRDVLQVTLRLPGLHEGDLFAWFPGDGLRRTAVRMEGEATVRIGR